MLCCLTAKNIWTQSRSKWCNNKDAKQPSSTTSSNDVNDDNKKKIMDHCPLVCAKERKPARIEKRAGIKKSKIKVAGKRYKCKWWSLKDKCVIKKGGKYLYEKYPLSCGKCAPLLLVWLTSLSSSSYTTTDLRHIWMISTMKKSRRYDLLSLKEKYILLILIVLSFLK